MISPCWVRQTSKTCCAVVTSARRRHSLALDVFTSLFEAKYSHLASCTLQRRCVNHKPCYNSNKFKSNTISTVSLCFCALLSCNANCRVCVKCIPLSQTWQQGKFQIHQPRKRPWQFARKKWNTRLKARFSQLLAMQASTKRVPWCFFFLLTFWALQQRASLGCSCL